MADIVTVAANPSGCGHYDLTASVVGVSTSIHVHETDLLEPLTQAEREALLLLTARVLRQSGLTLAQFVGRVLRGDEATNVKQYNLIAPGSAITKTNIGTAYSNILPGANGQRTLVEFTGCTEFRLVLSANLVGTGPFGVRVVRDGDSAVLYEASVPLTGERELDSDWQPIPGGVSGLVLLRAEAKSAVASDDPVFRRLVLLVR